MDPMRKPHIIKWLEIELLDAGSGEILYAGNNDEFVSCALFNMGNDGSDDEEGRHVYKTVVKPELGDFKELGITSFSHEEYGYVLYSLGTLNCDHLRFQIASHETNDRICQFIDLLRGVVLELPAPSYKPTDTPPTRIVIGRAWLVEDLLTSSVEEI
jgi:hypothetical protein